MRRLLSMIVLTSITALATYGARQMLAGQPGGSRRRARHAPKHTIETWEGEGGNLAPHETRSLQQQLG